MFRSHILFILACAEVSRVSDHELFDPLELALNSANQDPEATCGPTVYKALHELRKHRPTPFIEFAHYWLSSSKNDFIKRHYESITNPGVSVTEIMIELEVGVIEGEISVVEDAVLFELFAALRFSSLTRVA